MLTFSHFGELFVYNSPSTRRTRAVDRTLTIRFGLEIRSAVPFCVYVRVYVWVTREKLPYGLRGRLVHAPGTR